MRLVTRSLHKILNHSRKLRSKEKNPDVESSLEYDEVKVSGGSVDWRENKKVVKRYRFPVRVRISRTPNKGEYYKSVHAAKNTPSGVMVGLYIGDVVDKSDVRDGRWCICVPGYRGQKCLDSKISFARPWEDYLVQKAVGGFFNSSRKLPNSNISTNLKGANCEIRWFFKNYDASNINGGHVYAALFTKWPVRRGEEFLWNYNWLL